MGDESIDVEIRVPTLRRGVEPPGGPTVVRRVQHMLNDRGHGPLVEDGVFGPKTEAEVKKLQGNEGIGTDGVIGPRTWATLLTAWLLYSDAS